MLCNCQSMSKGSPHCHWCVEEFIGKCDNKTKMFKIRTKEDVWAKTVVDVIMSVEWKDDENVCSKCKWLRMMWIWPRRRCVLCACESNNLKTSSATDLNYRLNYNNIVTTIISKKLKLDSITSTHTHDAMLYHVKTYLFIYRSVSMEFFVCVFLLSHSHKHSLTLFLYPHVNPSVSRSCCVRVWAWALNQILSTRMCVWVLCAVYTNIFES